MRILSICTITMFMYFTISAQSEEALKRLLEGQRVEVLIEMPASSEGIDIFADQAQKMDFEDYSARIKNYGISLFPGDVVMITKVKKKNKHIEFQLAGGGYGTSGDDIGSVSSFTIPKSTRQEELEKILKEDKNKKLQDRAKLEKELKDLERDRSQRQNESNRQAALESEIKKSRIQEQRLMGGSRFNIRYDYQLGPEELTKANIEMALKNFVNFTPGTLSEHQMENKTSGNGDSGITKGMTLEETMTMMGIPKNLKTSNECGLEHITCTFENKTQKMEAIFVEKILVKYVLSSN